VLTAAGAVTTDAYHFGTLYQGGTIDTATGLYEFQRRDYSSTQGRWIEQDLLGTIDGANLYQLEKSRPESSADPSGMDDVEMTGGLDNPAPAQITGALRGIQNLIAYAVITIGNSLRWAVGASQVRAEADYDGPDTAFAVLIRASPSFQSGRDIIKLTDKGTISTWSHSHCTATLNETVSNSINGAVYFDDRSSWNPLNWFVGQLTIGRFAGKAISVISVSQQVDDSGHVTGQGTVHVTYTIKDPFWLHIAGTPTHEWGEFWNNMTWDETFNVKIDYTRDTNFDGASSGGSF
jgi:RHS repeat-associated protein